MSTIALPAVGFRPSFPSVARSESLDRLGQRALSSAEWADPVWVIAMTTVPLTAEMQLLIEAFREEATALQSVLYKPQHNSLPRAYWGTPSDAAVNDEGALVSVTDGKTVNVNGVTNGLTLGRGDLFSLASGDYRSLHRVRAAAVAANNAITLSVEPSVPPYIAAGAVARWRDPELNMRVVPGSFSLTDDFFPVASWSMTEVPR